jgi:ECF sigma factor
MRTPQPNEITQLLPRWSRGDQSALSQLMPAVYDDLYELAHSYLRRKRPDHTLQPSALINEAYLRLIKQDLVDGAGTVAVLLSGICSSRRVEIGGSLIRIRSFKDTA